METLQQVIERLGLSIRAEFVPFSKSRNAKEKHRSLNWRVTLVKRRDNADGDARFSDILTTDYSAGIAHCPAYKRLKMGGGRMTVEQAEVIEFETERGRASRNMRLGIGGPAINPNPVDVIYSLTRDSDVLDYGTFEDWAPELGFDPDSRNAESIYRACLEIALKLRNGIGDSDLAALREAAQEY